MVEGYSRSVYLLNPLALARDLRADRVSEGVKARYLAIGFTVQYVNMVWRSYSGSQPPSPSALLVQGAGTCAGFYLCYRANAAGDNRNFIERLFCLAVPLIV
ncbi:MAG TPA: hypothetical protein VF705_03030 [Longimicrobium sp.]|jgi:hypothetical protein